MNELLLNQVVAKAEEIGATRVFDLDIEEIPLNKKAYLLCIDCKTSKSNHLKRWSCPPYSLTLSKLRTLLISYERAVLVNVEFSFSEFASHNWDTFNPVIQLSQKLFHHNKMKKLHIIMIKLQKFLLQNGYGAYAFGSSPCHSCLICGHSWYLIGLYRGVCKDPINFRFSPEACGIDLYALAHKVGIPIQIPPRKYVQYMSLLLLREKLSTLRERLPRIDFNRCNRCLICQVNCPTRSIVISKNSINNRTCVRCEICIYLCPLGAIE